MFDGGVVGAEIEAPRDGCQSAGDPIVAQLCNNDMQHAGDTSLLRDYEMNTTSPVTVISLHFNIADKKRSN